MTRSNNTLKHLLAGLVIVASPMLAVADVVTLSSGIEYKNSRVLRVEEGNLVYRTSTGTETSKPLDQIGKLQIDNQPALNAAEEAMGEGQFDKAVDEYLKTVRSAPASSWIRDWATARLIESAQKAGRFDAAVTAYIGMVQKDAAAAAKYRPALPDGKSAYLQQAASEVERASNDRGLSDPQRQALLSFLLEIQRARGDTKAVAEVAERMSRMGGVEGAMSARAAADLKLGLAHVALDNKNYKKALEEINGARHLFVDPAQQADALYCIAEASYGLADKNDPTALKDAALNYMRVVAHFKDLPGQPFVVDSLMKTAAIHEQLKEPQTAIQLYQLIANSFPESPAAPKAKAKAEELKGAQAAG